MGDVVILGRIAPGVDGLPLPPSGHVRWLEDEDGAEAKLLGQHVRFGPAYDEQGTVFLAVGASMVTTDGFHAAVLAPLRADAGLEAAEWILDSLARVGGLKGERPPLDRIEGIARRLAGSAAELGFHMARRGEQKKLARQLSDAIAVDIRRTYREVADKARREVSGEIRKLAHAALIEDRESREAALSELESFIGRALSPPSDEANIQAVVERVIGKALGEAQRESVSA